MKINNNTLLLIAAVIVGMYLCKNMGKKEPYCSACGGGK